MNNLLKILISLFIVVSVNADQGVLTGITLDSTYTTTQDYQDIALQDDSLFSITSTSIYRFDTNAINLNSTASLINTGTDLRKVLTDTSNVFVLENNVSNGVIRILNYDLNITEGSFSASKLFTSFALDLNNSG